MALAALTAWALFAFGGAYFWTTIPLIAGAVALAAAVRPGIAQRGTRVVDLALCGGLLVAAFQLMPLPQPLRLAASPALAAVDRALTFLPPDAPDHPAAPLTVDRDATAESLALAVAVILFFWSARTVLQEGGVRRTARSIAICGLIASAIAVAQHTTAPRLLYWTWMPVDKGASPYSPFVNRNDLAAWLVMALPVTLGYARARLESRRGGIDAAAVDNTAVWLFASLCAMTAALVVTVSRSGVIAAIVGLVAFAWLARGRAASRGRMWVLAGLAFISLIAIAYGNLNAILARVSETVASGVGDRREIWDLTRRVAHDFWLTGVGVGAYARVMSVYQPPHDFSFNHAHSEYLQLLAEGGILLSVCAATAVVAGGIDAARRLRADRTPLFWIRAGAISAVMAIGVQSIWETGLRMPANGVLFALCCAIALQPSSSPQVSGRR